MTDCFWPGVLSWVRTTLRSLKKTLFSAIVGLLAQAPTQPIGHEESVEVVLH